MRYEMMIHGRLNFNKNDAKTPGELAFLALAPVFQEGRNNHIHSISSFRGVEC